MGLATGVGVKCGTVGPVFSVAADLSDLTGITTFSKYLVCTP